MGCNLPVVYENPILAFAAGNDWQLHMTFKPGQGKPIIRKSSHPPHPNGAHHSPRPGQMGDWKAIRGSTHAE